jgi:anti-sigma regulatory factor (Ser/Thr protein kinase)
MGAGGGMTEGQSVVVSVEDRSQIGEARRAAVAVAASAGFDESARSDIGIVATEAATNVVRHAGQGELLLRRVDLPGRAGVELVCVDSGPGIPDLRASLQDGTSSLGTMGGGFGAMRRLAQTFSVYSAPGIGTALVCRFWTGPVAAGTPIPVAGLAVPLRGESECGDAWSVGHGSSGPVVMVADGLGHGLAAAEASGAAVRVFLDQTHLPPALTLEAMHGALRATRGASVAIAMVDRERQEVRYAGVGNISAAVVSAGAAHRLVSHNGTVGFQVRKFQEFVYPWEHGSLLILHSDGLSAQWNLEKYPGLFREDPAIIAARIYRDHARRRDDACIVVCRLAEAAA